MTTTVEQILARKGRTTWTVAPSALVQEAVAVLAEHRIGAVLVCDGDQLLGMFSERDCVREMMWRGRTARDTRVLEVMIRQVITVGPTDSIEHCMALMNDRRIRHLPVVSGGHVVGVISIGDVVNAVLVEKQCLIDELECYITGSASVRPAAH